MKYQDLPKTSTFEGIHTVFVYGTLKEGFHNNRLLADAEKVDEGHTVRKYDMHFSGGLPYVLESGDTSKINGEVYLVNEDTFSKLARQGSLVRYPPLVEQEGVMVAQTEHSIFLGPDGVEILEGEDGPLATSDLCEFGVSHYGEVGQEVVFRRLQSVTLYHFQREAVD